LQTARLLPPRFAPGLSTTHGGIATGDPGVSPDRTHTGRPPRTCRSYVMRFSFSSWRRSSPGALVRCDSAGRGANVGAGRAGFAYALVLVPVAVSGSSAFSGLKNTRSVTTPWTVSPGRSISSSTPSALWSMLTIA
jgi:hypothetical protein